MMEAYALQLKFHVDHLAQLDSLIVPGEQSPVGKYFLPPEAISPLQSAAPAFSPGIMEISSMDTSTGIVNAVILGIITGDQSLIPEVIVGETALDTTTTHLTWIDGSSVSFPGNSVDFNANQLDSVHFFIGQMVPPNPVNETDSLVIQIAYMVGSYTLPDSTIEPVNLLTPATFTVNRNYLIVDSTVLGSLHPFRYDEQQQQWVSLDTLSGFGKDTLAFEISRTGIYGLGGTSNTVIPTEIKNDNPNTTLPKTFALEQNYPNPFNPVTTIRYQIPQAEKVTLILYDILGRQVRELVNENQAAGFYTVRFDASGLSSGIYFYQLKAGSFTQIRKMLLAK